MNTRSRRFKGLIAGVAGAALLLGGSTYALWSASDTANGGIITAGNLDIVSVGATSVWDVSPDRSDIDDDLYASTTCFNASLASADNAHAVASLSAYTVAPQDKIAFVFPFQMALQGDNLVAKLTLESSATTLGLHPDFISWLATNAPTDKGITVEAFVPELTAADRGTPPLIAWSDVTTAGALAADSIIGVFQAPNELAGSLEDPTGGVIPVVNAPSGTDPNLCVVVTVDIPDFEDQTLVLTDLADFTVGVKLEQVRTPAGLGSFI